MAILSKVQFYKQVADQSDYYNVNSYNGKSAPYQAHIAWDMYIQATRTRHKFLVFGRTNIERPNAARLPGAIEEIDLWNLGATNDDIGNKNDYIPASFQGGGSILRYQTVAGKCAWHELYNHAWLLGGIHIRTEFHSASPRTKALIFSGAGPSMWGHELLFLDYFGYWPRKTFDQEIWKPLGATPDATLGNFINYFNGIKTNTDFIWRNIGDPSATAQMVTRADRNKWARTQRRL